MRCDEWHLKTIIMNIETSNTQKAVIAHDETVMLNKYIVGMYM